MNVLAVGAHYDDIELGCSGTLIKHVKNKDKVYLLVITDSAYKNPKGKKMRTKESAAQEGRKAAKIIGADLICFNYKALMVEFDESITRKITHFIEELKIDTVYTHWTHDLHRDHQYIGRSTLMAARHVPRFLMYRSNFYDTEHQFRGNFYSDISDVIDKKIKAIKAYKTEMERVNYSWLDFFIKQNENFGRIIGVKYAECFEIVKYII